MAAFLGGVQGTRREATRLGGPRSGLRLRGQDWSAQILVRFTKDAQGRTFVRIEARALDAGTGRVLFDGLLADLVRA